MKRFLALTSVLLALVLGLGWSSGTIAQEPPKEIVIGATLAQTGPLYRIVEPFKKLGDTWAAMVNEQGGIMLKKYNRKVPVRFVVYDDKSDPPTSQKFYERLAAVDQVHFFMGPFSSFVTNAAAIVAGKEKIPMLLVCANDQTIFDKPNEWRVTQLAPPELEYKRVIDLYAKKGGLKTFAVVARDNLHERGSAAGAAAELRKAGVKVVYEQLVPPDTKDFSSIIARIKQENPDGVLFEGISPPFTIAFLKQAKELGLRPKELVVGHAPRPVIAGIGPDANNLTSVSYYFAGDTPDHKEYLELLKRTGFKWHEYPESAIRFWTYKTIKATLEKAGSLDRAAIRQAMWEVDLKIFGERMVHDKLGYGTLYPYPIQVQDGEVVSLWPLDKGAKLHRHRH